MSPLYAFIALLILSGFVSHAILFGAMILFGGVYLCIYLRLVADNFVITSECIGKVLAWNPRVYTVLLATAHEEWADVDAETDLLKMQASKGSCNCGGCSY